MLAQTRVHYASAAMSPKLKVRIATVALLTLGAGIILQVASAPKLLMWKIGISLVALSSLALVIVLVQQWAMTSNNRWRGP